MLGLCHGCVGAVLGSWVVMGNKAKKRAKRMSKKHVKNVGLFKGCVRAVPGLCWLLGIGPRGLGLFQAFSSIPTNMWLSSS